MDTLDTLDTMDTLDTLTSSPGQMHQGSINGSDMPSALGLVNTITHFHSRPTLAEKCIPVLRLCLKCFQSTALGTIFKTCIGGERFIEEPSIYQIYTKYIINLRLKPEGFKNPGHRKSPKNMFRQLSSVQLFTSIHYPCPVSSLPACCFLLS